MEVQYKEEIELMPEKPNKVDSSYVVFDMVY
jgi:hypothetical protein